ncbi:hypothetical protein ACFQGA_17155 [Marinobacter koreensis]|uniref:DUF5666 domain-containing protein n=1 Tax=Marinobacter koreensis TaxID=335974 RepID=A0ABW0RML8_9GAMM|nr:hypothetical protein [Marinobacter koreensis]MCK7549844.1 hypothetical protein [Marinobacter koreensis]
MALFSMIHRYSVAHIAFSALLLISILNTPSLRAEERPDSEITSLTPGQTYVGTVNSVNQDQSLLIIDDQAFVLNRVVHFEGSSWSREQVLLRLKPGSTVSIVVGEIVDESRGARSVSSIKVKKD